MLLLSLVGAVVGLDLGCGSPDLVGASPGGVEAAASVVRLQNLAPRAVGVSVAAADLHRKAFDPRTATQAKVRIVAVHDSKSWSPCGVLHSVGTIEVEVLEVGEPPPRMIIRVSCPVDWGQRKLFIEGSVLHVQFHWRRPMWPTPAYRVPDGMPVRYLRTAEVAT